MPDGLSGPMRELMVRLHELHALAGWPSTRTMAKTLPFSHFTIHQMFTRPDLPRSTVYADVVALLARLNPWGDEEEICDRMSRLWLAAYHYLALNLEPGFNRPSSGRQSAEQESVTKTTNDQPVPRQPVLPSPVLPNNFTDRHPDLPRLDSSRAVIVGAGNYSDLDLMDLPSVVPGAQALHALLTTDAPAFLPDSTVAVMNGTRSDVLSAVHDATEEATDTLLLYYAGHGLLTSSGELTLAATDTQHHRPFTAIPYDEVRELLARSPARRKAVILDCCFAGRAFAMGTVAELAAATGTYVLTSSSANRAAMAPPDKQYPDFTGALIDILERGVKGGPEVLDLQTIFHVLQERLTIEGSSRPRMMVEGGVRLSLGLNHASDPSGTDPQAGHSRRSPQE
ncbi:caspase family protein [Streptomyces sp. NPDC055287]